MDIGGHRFFSKSDRVMQWWAQILPFQSAPGKEDQLATFTYRNQKKTTPITANGADPEKTDKVMLIRQRISRIFAFRKFFKYPISLSAETFSNFGLVRTFRIGMSYLQARLFPIRPEVSLRDFLINRFGKELYLTFFKSYTEKVWGVPCRSIKAEWGAQRIKGLSLSRAVWDRLLKIFSKKGDIRQKNIETSLIEQFLYPKYGPGQLWDEVARIVKDKGAEIHEQHRVIGIHTKGSQVMGVTVQDGSTGKVKTQKADFLFSTMPVKDLVQGLGEAAPQEVREVAQGLCYRDFITVGVLLKHFKIKSGPDGKTVQESVPDNWIYIQEEDVKVGRIQIFNNWSPYLVKDPNTVWLGMEYFCNEGDKLWNLPDDEMKKFAVGELCRMRMAEPQDVLDTTMIRMQKTLKY